jgi:hypothetical protein
VSGAKVTSVLLISPTIAVPETIASVIPSSTASRISRLFGSGR